jgi:hypothetical protein
MAFFWTLLLRAVWVMLLLISSVIALFMFAFADSPEAGKASQKMIGPIFVITLIDFALSGWLLMHATWWSVQWLIWWCSRRRCLYFWAISSLRNSLEIRSMQV